MLTNAFSKSVCQQSVRAVHRRTAVFALGAEKGGDGCYQRFSGMLWQVSWLALGWVLLAGTAAAAPVIEHWSLANGARVYFVRSPALPMVQIKAVFDAGSARDPRDKHGLACLTNTMLKESAGALSADDIADRLDRVGAQLHSGCGRDMSSFDLRSLSGARALRPALEMFAALLAKPSFPGDSLKRERKRALLALQHDAQSPGAIVRKAFHRAIYGDHPYAHDPRGEKTGLTTLDRADLVRHHRRYYVGANAVLAFVGGRVRLRGNCSGDSQPVCHRRRFHRLRSWLNRASAPLRFHRRRRTSAWGNPASAMTTRITFRSMSATIFLAGAAWCRACMTRCARSADWLTAPTAISHRCGAKAHLRSDCKLNAHSVARY